MDQGTRILTVSSTKTCKNCPYKYYLHYNLGLRPIREATPLRFGTNWHRVMELLGGGMPLDGALDEARENYATRPVYIEQVDWDVEWWTLAAAATAYVAHYQGDGVEVVATESEFCLPITNPATGRASTKWRKAGKIDKIVKINGQNMVEEHKTTSDDLGADSDYWKCLRLDSQPSMYVSAAKELGCDARGIFYDVFRKPQIQPKKLSMKDTVDVLTTGRYCGQALEAKLDRDGDRIVAVAIDGEPAEIEYLKTGVAIRETPSMFGARLLQDMTERPDHYFARYPLARTDRDLEDTAKELWLIMQTINAMQVSGGFYRNESSCLNYGRCPYVDICFGGIDPTDGIPDGYEKVDNVHGELLTIKENDDDKHTSPAPGTAQSDVAPAASEA